MARWIDWKGERWRLTHLARVYGVPVGTLSHRIGLFGETATGVHRALCTGIKTRVQAGQQGARSSPWRKRSE